jgi:hypothetical protein
MDAGAFLVEDLFRPSAKGLGAQGQGSVERSRGTSGIRRAHR